MSVIVPVVIVLVGLLLSLLLILVGALLFVRIQEDALKLQQYKREVHERELDMIQSKQDMLAAQDDPYDGLF